MRVTLYAKGSKAMRKKNLRISLAIKRLDASTIKANSYGKIVTRCELVTRQGAFTMGRDLVGRNPSKAHLSWQ